MKYMLLIHQGDTPTPRDPEAWARLSEDEQKAVFADYQAINQTPGVTPGLGLAAPETATTVRVEDGKTLTTDGPFVAVKEALGGCRERLLSGFLGEVEVAEEADQRRQDAAPFVAEDLLYHSWIGRTSTAPPRRAAGMRAATSIASSRSSASKKR